MEVGVTWTVAAELQLGVTQEAIVEARGRGQTVVREEEEVEEILAAAAGAIRPVAATRREAVVFCCKRSRTPSLACRVAVSETIHLSRQAKPATIFARPQISPGLLPNRRQ